MTARAKEAANELRERLFEAAEWICVVSGEPLRLGVPQLGHRVAATKSSLMKWGEEVIHHPLNLIPVKGLRENDAVNIGNRPVERDELIRRIIRANTSGDQPNMRTEYALLREQFSKEGWG
jgi:hypothetical protein